MEKDDNYYKKIIREASEYIEDFVRVVEGDSAKSYYSYTKSKVISKAELVDLLTYLKSESSGK